MTIFLEAEGDAVRQGTVYRAYRKVFPSFSKCWRDSLDARPEAGFLCAIYRYLYVSSHLIHLYHFHRRVTHHKRLILATVPVQRVSATNKLHIKTL